MFILAIESSCDDTAAAIYVPESNTVLANVISSQNDVHALYGGIVPELASRCHIEAVWPVVESALKKAEVQLNDIALICATQGPGLVGSLLVGFTFAKALAMVRDVPCVGVDHMSGHLLSCQLEPDAPEYPYTALIVSGGNTSLYSVHSPTSYSQIGRTRDDAAGEAFDKVAKLLEMGYPGGPVISNSAEKGNPEAINFPRAWLSEDSLDFSFSGLKTSVMNHVNTLRQQQKHLELDNICASFQEAVVDVLVKKTIRAAQINGHNRVALGGGVASNKRLRTALRQACTAHGIQLYVPKPIYCTDNAAMIAYAGYQHFLAGQRVQPDDDAYSRSPLH
ncbi:tRNA (adenosine(37)-N6)-threonylcarbamoyltransferase complex transferase subunit TsaD [Desulfogranum japonicum]|uniref:tRNA (adenosine(37)-N6)-threonylcarbamoyltransferase complex transferase subunit TsaD n=1 Tax=Desulfogranum japonicum TaxID=231447 RepID=UPI0004256ECB|nr:tRNA (adenosine(37)-N6)-threonylcarbamoyltransferase complex transferase subunit TsaD [Desulfogranum japonicum]